MEILWLGHSCFRLRGKETTVITDPFDRSLGYPVPRLAADIVTTSHEDPHHSYLPAVGGNPFVVDGPGEYEVRGTMITGVRTYRDKVKGRARGKNTSYLIETDDLVICHLGDLGHVLSPDQVAVMKDPDVLFIPVGGHCTINATEAAEVVSQLEPKIAIPMHYRTPAVRLELDTIEKFCREMGIEGAASQPKLNVTKSTLPEETTIVLLDYRRQG